MILNKDKVKIPLLHLKVIQHGIAQIVKHGSSHSNTAKDWMANQYIVRSQRGTTEIVDYLPQVWEVVESVCNKPVDPLNPDLLNALRSYAPISRTP